MKSGIYRICLASKGKPKLYCRKLDKWPHELGYNCKCLECSDKRKNILNCILENAEQLNMPEYFYQGQPLSSYSLWELGQF